MTIGKLYNANNVMVGQAAVFFAPANTALPTLDKFNLADPFDPAPFVTFSVTVAASSSYKLTVNGTDTSALTDTSTPANIQAALEAIVGTGNAVVAGTGTAYTVIFTEGVILYGTLVATTTSGTATVVAPLWVPCGATDQGWKFGTNKSTQVTNIEEQSTPIATAINTQAVTIEGSLSEELGPLLAMAFNADLTQHAATASLPGYEELNPTDIVKKYAVCMVTLHTNGKPRIHYAPAWTQLTNTSVNFRRSAAKRMYPVVFSTVCKPSDIRIINLLQPKTA